jgi:hypothetical protein
VTLLIALWIWSTPQLAAQPSAPRPDLLQQIACAPAGLPAPPVASMRVLGGYVQGRSMFGPGDAIIVGAGTAQGVQKGQQYYIRRSVQNASTPQPKVGALYGVHTAGWVTVVDVKEAMAVATVSHSCDGVLEGDYLEPYVPPALPAAALTGAPDYEHPGHIVMADELRQTGTAGMFMLMDRGVDDGVRAGQFLTIFRETHNGQGPLLDVGRATVFSANAKSSVVRIDSSREAVYLGDLVAIHRITPTP